MPIHTTNRKLLYLIAGLIFLALLIATRFLNLSQTARFTNDESSDLARMYQLGHNFKITLVGPISNDNSKVFGSLTYYLLLPATMILNYSAVSPSVGMAFWSCITAILLVILAYLENKKLWMLVAVLSIIWYPLLETGRWGWNPHLMPLWIIGGLLLYKLARARNTLLLFLVSGVAFGLSVHHHYVAIVAILGFVLGEVLQIIPKKIDFRQQLTRCAVVVAGILVALSPFLLFDLRHPPGLFLTRYLQPGVTPNIATNSSTSYFERLSTSVTGNAVYLSGEGFFVWLFAGLFIFLIVRDWRQDKKSLLRLVPVILQLVAVSFLDTFATRYFLPAIPFVLYWILYPRVDFLSHRISQAVLVTMIVASIFVSPALLVETRIQPTPDAFDKIVSQIRQSMLESPTKDVNIAVLASPDGAPLGESYRNILGMHGVALKQPSEYDTSSRLFVISTSSEAVVRADQSIAMIFFRDVPTLKSYQIDGTDWNIYWLQK